MRLVLDTYTVLSGLLWAGTPGRLIDAAQAGRVEVLSSVVLLAELQGVIGREKFARQLALRRLNITDLFDGYAALVRLVAPANIAPTILRDPADDAVLAAAVAGNASLIVSGDRHLLDLGHFQDIRILRPADAVAELDRVR